MSETATRPAEQQPEPQTDGYTVLQAPDYGDGNPYQNNLAIELQHQGNQVVWDGADGFVPLLRTARSEDADIVHLHWLNAYLYGGSGLRTLLATVLTALQLVALRSAGIPIVWTVHNRYTHDTPNPRLERLFRWWLANFIVSHIIVHGPEAVAEIIDAYRLPPRAADRITIVPHGHYIGNYDFAEDRSAARARLGIPDDATVYLSFGMIRPYKQVPALIDAFRSVATSDDVLLVAGEPNRPWLERQVRQRAGSDDRVRLDLRRIPDAEVGTYFAAADAVVIPYRDVLTSGSAVLAMSAERAVIAPRIGCLPSQIGDGILYDPASEGPDHDTITILAGALEDSRDHDLDELGRCGRTRIERYDWSTVAEGVHDVFEQVVEDP